jgi:hypothetical protein
MVSAHGAARDAEALNFQRSTAGHAAQHTRKAGFEAGKGSSVDQMGFDALSPADQEYMLIGGDGPTSRRRTGSIRDAWSHGDARMLDNLISRSGGLRRCSTR